MLVKIELVTELGGAKTLVEAKNNNGTYEMYVNGSLHGSTSSYETCRDEVSEYAASFMKYLFDQQINA